MEADGPLRTPARMLMSVAFSGDFRRLGTCSLLHAPSFNSRHGATFLMHCENQRHLQSRCDYSSDLLADNDALIQRKL